MKINLERPIIFFDLETTGTRVWQDRIVSIAVIKIFPDHTINEKHLLINPEIPIPAGATAVHGITNEDVRNKPFFRQIAKSLKDYFTGCDIGGYNCVSFDIPLLAYEFERVGIEFPEDDVKVIDVQRIYHKKEPRTLSAALKYYCQKEHEEAHDALADVKATIDVFYKQLEVYSDIGNTAKDLADFIKDPSTIDIAGKLKRNDEGEITFAFGKNIGKRVKDELEYATWMMEKGDFSINTKKYLRKILAGEVV